MADFVAGIEYIPEVMFGGIQGTYTAGIEYIPEVMFGGVIGLAPVDVTDPSVGSVTPSPGVIGRSTTISFQITDAVLPKSGVALAAVLAVFADRREVVYDGSSFLAPYTGSSTTPIADGASFSIARTGGWNRGAFTLRILAVDGGGNALTGDYTWSVSPDPDAAPAISYTPASGNIAPSGSIFVDVTEDEGAIGLATTKIEIVFDGVVDHVELARDAAASSGSATTPYVATISSITDGYRYTLSRTGGWSDDFRVRTTSTDRDGNATTTTSALFTRFPAVAPVDTTPPVIANMTPTPGTLLQPTDPISFDVTDNTGLFRRVMVAVFFPSTGITELVHDGDGFLGFFATSSSRALIAGGFRFTLLRVGGWLSSPTVRVFPIDRSGNEG